MPNWDQPSFFPVKNTYNEPFTDYSRWRLLVNDGGRQTWHYLETEEQCNAWPQSTVDKYWLGLNSNLPELPTPRNPLQAARNGYSFYKNLQCSDGHWAGEYGGPMFLLPGLVIGSYVTGTGFKDAEKKEMARYLFNRANEDGGWGIHIEGHSTVFGTGLNYVALRLLGVDAEHPVCVRARGALHKLGGCTGIPSWGKCWLAILNVYHWDGLNPIIPELWLLPEWFPVHPHKWWIQTRNVFTPMSYLYGVRFTMPANQTILALRQEIYVEEYSSIHWPSQRNNISPSDLYAPHSQLFDHMTPLLSLFETYFTTPFRQMALKRVYDLICMEDENTSYQTIAPVSKMLHQVARYHREGPSTTAFQQHTVKRQDFLWLGPGGMMVNGTNGSQVWDTAFITQAVVGAGLFKDRENQESLARALEWWDGAQITANPKYFEVAYRHPTKGAWGFSTREQGYTVSDCTGEGLKSVLFLQGFLPQRVSERRLCDAIDVLLPLQNPGGGFSSYEPIRGSWIIELLNPAEVFGKVMIEYSYPECTNSAISALAIFRKRYPHYRSEEIDRAIREAVTYIHSIQTPEGGWVGAWGICFTYAAAFALESLALVGETYENSNYAHKACEFLLRKQRADGGWGESYKSCEESRWVEHADTQVVQTCWAALALMYAQYPKVDPIVKAVKMVMGRQQPDGSWKQEAIEGVFNKNVAISYPNFKFAFPIWMLGKADAYIRQRAPELFMDGTFHIK